ncbi:MULTISPECIES: protein-L-isoaspartate(D-aspartate) O-methyltransferase [Bradyrhizobium]|uniref:Protein-L-isoaspartate O-methyltransferase n=1 Tax=Bradyrhizobium elkanii TaxID=29448 RepID=A0A4U6S215_BRAEL|nr:MULTISPECIES: protein-L-isoaspartate(D-aspartate) O-methyltransferase [Bradyrhizobium]MTV15467.1 protein-L-isoaspartate(D-aspartate) O-methyltransferase [Bradyrhizobium sp. BR2003]TKV81190.1 protein-L-isoaspartate(D-aspartate) O-methyltransferase [Bradyrhizobium elkanii]
MGVLTSTPARSGDETSFPSRRKTMVERDIAARGVRDELVLEAMRKVPRELFLPKNLQEFAYEDAPLPIAGDQTISQPYIVAFMVEALMLRGGEKVLEIGAGSGYAAAVLSEIAANVYTVERLGPLAETAARTLADLGYDNVHVLHGDGTRGWPDHAPYDAIIVAAGGPQIPESLKEQLKIGGRLVMPVGSDQRSQELVRVTRVSANEYRSEDIADVRFVPLIGEEGWPTVKNDGRMPSRRAPRPVSSEREMLVRNLADAAEPFASIEAADLNPLMERIGPARVVLLGEATHGTSEFYRMRARITRDLIIKKGFHFVAIEADWPDAARVDHYVRHFQYPPSEWTAFARFPTWMWRNAEMRDFVSWLRKHNGGVERNKRVACHGLDLYSLYDSIRSVLNYLDEVDPQSARVARERYGCLTPWQRDPATYGHAALTGSYPTCEPHVVRALTDLLEKRRTYAEHDGDRFLDAEQNARLVANAERYYRIMYYGSRASWNLRDNHMFETLKNLLAYHGPDSKAVVWAHNSHVGNANATEMAARGEYNLGQLCRSEFGDGAYMVGFGTHSGTVAAASEWDGPMEIKAVRPSHPESYERLCHATGLPRFMLALSERGDLCGPSGLGKERLERAVGVIYRPDTELGSHYFRAVLPQQFDEFVWFDDSCAVTPLETAEIKGLPDTYPFGV